MNNINEYEITLKIHVNIIDNYGHIYYFKSDFNYQKLANCKQFSSNLT